MGRPQLLLLDEPSMGLAPVLVDLIFETIETIPDARSMLSTLLADNEKIIKSIGDALLINFTPEQRGIENFLQDRLDIHQKHGWMLRSLTKK